MSTIISKVRTTTGKVYKKWEDKNNNTFYTKTGGDSAGGRVSKQAWASAHKHIANRDVSIPIPSEGQTNVTIEDSRIAGKAANYYKNEISAEEDIYLESINETFTAEEIKEAYDEYKNISDDVVKYLGDA